MSDRHEIIASEDVGEYNVWTAYVPPQIRFVNPLPYATVVFDADQQSMHEAFADNEEDALANQAEVVTSILKGTFEIMELDEFELTDEQQEAYKQYMIEELSVKLAEGMLAEQPERDPATGHHPDCDGECGGTGKPFTEKYEGEDDLYL